MPEASKILIASINLVQLTWNQPQNLSPVQPFFPALAFESCSETSRDSFSADVHSPSHPSQFFQLWKSKIFTDNWKFRLIGSPLSLISENVFKLEPCAAANGIKLETLKQSQGKVENLVEKVSESNAIRKIDSSVSVKKISSKLCKHPESLIVISSPSALR